MADLGLKDHNMSGSNKLEAADYRLKNLNNALYVDGNNDIVMRTGFAGNIVISGNVNVPGIINVQSSAEDPVDIHIRQVGTSGILNVDYLPVGQRSIWYANINNFPTSTTITSGNLSIYSLPAVAQSGVWYANINNFPTSTTITSGSVSATQSGVWYANINNFPTSTTITSGNIAISIGGSTVSNSNPFSVNVVGNVAGITTLPAVDIKSMPAMTGNVYILNSNSAPANVRYGDTVQMDTTDRLRVSVMGQQWWYVPAIDKDGDLRIQEAFQGTGASSTFIQNLASVRMTSGTTYNANAKLTGSAIRASRRRHKSRPGVSLEWMGIVNWDGLQTNVVKRIGMFTAYNGAFFEANATCINTVVRRRLTDGTLVEVRTPHTAWNKDNMSGTGASGYNWNLPDVIANVTSVTNTANISIPGDGNVYTVTYQLTAGEETRLTVGRKVTASGLSPTTYNDTGLITAIDTVNHRANVAYIAYPGTYSSASSARLTSTEFHQTHTYWYDMNGSRTARIRFGIMTDVGKVIVHEERLGEIGTQNISSPAMMDRKEIVNTGVPVAFLPSMTVSGSAISIETQSEINPGFGVAQKTTAVAYDKGRNDEFALMAIGIRDGEPYQRADLQLNSVQIVDIANVNSQQFPVYQYRLVLNPTLSGTIPAPVDTGKATHVWDYATGVTISGGVNLSGGYFVGTAQLDLKTALNFLNMGSNIDYTDSDKIVLAVKLAYAGSANGSLIATMNYTEDL